MYPLRRLYKPQGLLVEFTGLNTATVIDTGISSYDVGVTYSSFTPHTDNIWTLPQSNKLRLLKQLKAFI